MAALEQAIAAQALPDIAAPALASATPRGMQIGRASDLVARSFPMLQRTQAARRQTTSDTAPAPHAPPRHASLGQALLAEGAVSVKVLRQAMAEGGEADLPDSLIRLGALTPHGLAAQMARWQGLALVDPRRTLPDGALIDRIGARRCLELGVLPIGTRAGRTLLGLVDPRRLAHLRPGLEAALGPIAPVVIAAPDLHEVIWHLRRQELRRTAETRVSYAESCRQITPLSPGRLMLVTAVVGGLAVAFAPLQTLLALTLWALVTLAATLVLRAGTLIASGDRRDGGPKLHLGAPGAPRDPDGALLPVISVIVPLYREDDIAPRLLRRLGRIDYPRARLEVILAVEEEDHATRDALVGARLPGWMRVVTVPDGPLRTKPRALNYTLPFCSGSIIGIYDAEDAPARDQLRKVAAHFAARGPEVACLQGVLDYYNPGTNWLARCFALEYAIWFRMVMPGLQRLGIPLPLGGTTLFLRRDAIEALGAWDAHNVTEDADLGIRLAVHGYRTEMLDSTTEEEANCRARPWVRQRSRWIKGHMLTWAVHMRQPLRLAQRLGPVGFLGYQVVFLGAQSQFLLAPLLWSFWLVALGLGHPVQPLLPEGAIGAMIAMVVLAEALSLTLAVLAGRRTRHPGLWYGAPFLHIYFPMATLAAWRALYEALTRPYYWAKTSHGHFDGAAVATPKPAAQREATSPASIRSRVWKAREICWRSA